MGPPTNNDAQKISVRVKNVKRSSFQFQFQEWSANPDNFHPAEKISYMVVEEGEWELKDGSVIQAGRISADDVSGTNIGEFYRTDVTFSTENFNFYMAPVVFSTVTSQANQDNVYDSMVTDVTELGFSSYMFAGEGKSIEEQESIDWVAW
jgi:hypothetical protein